MAPAIGEGGTDVKRSRVFNIARIIVTDGLNEYTGGRIQCRFKQFFAGGARHF